MHIAVQEEDKDYPYILWNLDTWKGVLNWGSSTIKKEKVKVTVYIFAYFDRGAVTQTKTKETVYDELDGYFRTYCSVLNSSSTVQITNLNNMPREYWPIGITRDADIGISYEVEMDIFCG